MARSSSTTLRIGALSVAWADVLQSDDSALSPENLGASDQRRFVQLDVRRRRQFLTGRALVTDMVAERFGARSVDTGSCPACGGDHGPPVVRDADVRASVSYAGHLVVAAMGGVARLGIDVESELRDVPKDRERAEDMGRLLGVRASGAIRRWTQIEAVLKADGRGLRVDPARVRIVGSSARVADDPTARYRLRPIAGPPGFCISVAWSTGLPRR